MGNWDSTVVAFLTDGRKEYLEQTVKSWEEKSDILKAKHRIIFDDSADKEYQDYLKSTYTNYTVVPVGETRLRFNRAMHSAHKHVRSLNCSHTVWIEDDQILLVEIDILDMIEIVDKHKLFQLSLVRAPFFYDELGDKNIIETLSKNGWPISDLGDCTVHNVMFAAHPHVFPNSILECEWQQDDDALMAESNFGKKLLSLFPRASNNQRFGFYGNIDSEPQTKHIGKHGNNTVKYYWNEDEDWFFNE
jgi:hypothetical protein